MSKETKITGRESDKFMLRLPEGMRDRIAAHAKAAGRSMNAEIVQRLSESLDVETGHVERISSQLRALDAELDALSLSHDLASGKRGVSETAWQRLVQRAKEWQCTVREALEQAVLSGTSEGPRPVIVVPVTPGATLDDYHQLFASAASHLPKKVETIIRVPELQEPLARSTQQQVGEQPLADAAQQDTSGNPERQPLSRAALAATKKAGRR